MKVRPARRWLRLILFQSQRQKRLFGNIYAGSLLMLIGNLIILMRQSANFVWWRWQHLEVTSLINTHTFRCTIRVRLRNLDRRGQTHSHPLVEHLREYKKGSERWNACTDAPQQPSRVPTPVSGVSCNGPSQQSSTFPSQKTCGPAQTWHRTCHWLYISLTQNGPWYPNACKQAFCQRITPLLTWPCRRLYKNGE